MESLLRLDAGADFDPADFVGEEARFRVEAFGLEARQASSLRGR